MTRRQHSADRAGGDDRDDLDDSVDPVPAMGDVAAREVSGCTSTPLMLARGLIRERRDSSSAGRGTRS